MLAPALICAYFLVFTKHSLYCNGAFSITFVTLALMGTSTLLGFELYHFIMLFQGICRAEDPLCSREIIKEFLRLFWVFLHFLMSLLTLLFTININ